MTYTSAPLSTTKSIVSETWIEFILQLKQAAKEGKQEVHRLMYQDSYFKCLLVNGKNESLVKCLAGITGSEVNVLELIDMLREAANVKTKETKEVEQQTVSETPSSPVNAVEKQRESGVDVSVVKPRSTPRKRSKKQGELL